MKNQETDLVITTQNFLAESSQLETLQAEIASDVPKKKDGIYCMMSNISKHVCMNKYCTKYAFVCQDEECKCQGEHKKCIITKNSTLINAIKGKIVSIKPLEDVINSTIDKMIDDLSDFRDKLLIQIKQIFQYCGLNNDLINLLISLNTGNVEKLTGAEISKVNMSESHQQQFQQKIQAISYRIESNMLQKFQLLTSEIQAQFHDFHAFQTKFCDDNQLQTLSHKVLKFVRPVENIISSSFLENSKIIKNLSQSITLHQFFQPKKLETFPTLLYRASQNSFCTTQFHDKCDYRENTLTLCQTTSGKIIGGYSTRSWGYYVSEQSEKYQRSYSVDQNGDSFIFSLTHKDKFRLSDEKKAILKWKKQAKVGPSFGSKQDLIIHDKANENFNSYINLNGSYLNQLYNIGGGGVKLKVNNQRFIGQSSQNKTGKDNHFSLKQWQVWQISFVQQSQSQTLIDTD